MSHRPASLLPIAGLLAALLASGLAAAQGAPAPSIHWAYASYFGTGWYRLSDSQSAFVFSLKPELLHREDEWPDGSDSGSGTTFRLRAPFTVGIANLDFEDIPGIIDPNNLSVASLGILADADVRITQRLSLRPNVELSYGTPFGESQYAWTWRGDLRSRYAFKHGKLEWWLQGSLGAVGYDSNRGLDDSFTYAGIGAEFAYPLSDRDGERSQMLLYWHLRHVNFFDEITVQTRASSFDSVTNYWQVGAALGKREERLKLWFLSFDRLGLSYNFSPSGELRGLEIVFRSIYEP